VRRVCLATLVLFLASAPDGFAQSFVVRATASVQRLGDFTITANPTLRGTTKAFGPADECSVRSWFGLAVWRTLGFRMRLTTLGTLAPGRTFCTDPGVWIDSATVTGRRWHTAKGLLIGDSWTKFHRLYPHARRFRQGWGITAVYERCVIGVCPHRYEWVARLTAAFRNGRLQSFVFPVGAQGE
jgi:hypothetical protein